MQLLLATGNAKKVRELRAMLEPLGVRVLLPSELGGLPETVEDQPTFVGNARKKAREAALHCAHACLADDSGLEVEALDGAPGVRSARYAGDHGDDAANNEKLLAQLGGLGPERRGARFVCALALARADGSIEAVFEGHASGRILDAPRGDGDFGYDPLFLFTEEGYEQTGRGFAELTPTEKSVISHRGRALRALAQHLSARVAAQ